MEDSLGSAEVWREAQLRRGLSFAAWLKAVLGVRRRQIEIFLPPPVETADAENARFDRAA